MSADIKLPPRRRERQMGQQITESPAADKLAISKDRLKAWSACTSGYRWFVEKFPQGGQFAEVYAALQADKRFDDSSWLLDRVFAELDTAERVRQTVLTSGADEAKIAELAKDGGPDAAATTGYRANAATTGAHAVAAALGINAKAKAGADGAIVLVRRNIGGDLLHIFASKVGQNGIKADTWYELDEAGAPREVAA